MNHLAIALGMVCFFLWPPNCAARQWQSDKPDSAVESLLAEAENGNDAAQVALGEMCENGIGLRQNFRDAFMWFRRAADKGNPDGQYRLGVMYANGLGVKRNDVDAAKWFLKSAEQGNASAQVFLGVLYEKGRSVEMNDVTAAKWYRAAAEIGNEFGQVYLGEMYAEGRGVPMDDTKAVRWFRESAEQGNVTAQLNLGVMYAEGSGTPQDFAEAARWYRAAAEQGNEAARKSLELLYRQGRGNDPNEADEERKVNTVQRVTQPAPPAVDYVDNAPEIAVPDKVRLAVVLGIENYFYTGSVVTHAVNDAEVVRDYFIKTLGVASENIYFKTNERATAAEFLKAFSPDGWLARRVTPGESIIYVYYSGHGAPDPATRGTYLIPYDVDPNYPHAGGFALTDLYGNLASLNAKSVHVFLDACFTGETGRSKTREMILADARGVFIADKTDVQVDGLTILTACRNDEISSSYPAAGHGLFTYFLLRAWSGGADADQNGNLTVGEMSDYVIRSVKAKSGELDRKQTPELVSCRDPNAVFLELKR